MSAKRIYRAGPRGGSGYSGRPELAICHPGGTPTESTCDPGPDPKLVVGICDGGNQGEFLKPVPQK